MDLRGPAEISGSVQMLQLGKTCAGGGGSFVLCVISGAGGVVRLIEAGVAGG
jgi:hypothetical protein